MPSPNVFIEQNITKRVKKFINKDGQIVDITNPKDADTAMGDNLGRAGTPGADIPAFPGAK